MDPNPLGYVDSLREGGFNFDNCIRNTALAGQTLTPTPSTHIKTGTTIVGLIFKVSKALTKQKRQFKS
jgi:hypothetical protein